MKVNKKNTARIQHTNKKKHIIQLFTKKHKCQMWADVYQLSMTVSQVLHPLGCWNFPAH